MLLHPVFIMTNAYNMLAFVDAGPIIPDDAVCIVMSDSVQGTNGFRDVSDAVHVIRDMVETDTFPRDMTGEPLDCYDMDPDGLNPYQPVRYRYWELVSKADRVVDLTDVLSGFIRAYGTMID